MTVPPEQIRWNQTLVGPDGRQLLNIRPDIQWVDESGRVKVIEIIDTNPPPAGRERQIEQALGPAFGGYREIHVSP